MDSSGFVQTLLQHGIYIGTVATLILCGMGLPIPEELVFLTVGYFGASHGSNIWLLCAVGLLGIVLGDSIPFFLGRRYGLDLMQHRYFAKMLPPKRIDATRDFFQKHGSKTVFLARFVAGLRMPTFFMSGAMGLNFWKFLSWDLLGAMISCPVSIWLAYTFGAQAKELLEKGKIYVFIFLGLLAAYLVFHVWNHKRGDSGPSGKKDASHTQPDSTGLTPPATTMNVGKEKA